MLVTDIATSLRGRTLPYEVFPLSFREKLQFKGINTDFNLARNKAVILNEFNLFLLEGGYPEVALNTDIDFRKLIQNYFYVMLYKDIIERYNISNIAVLKYYIRRIVANLTKPLSVTKIYNEMRTAGLKTDKNLKANFWKMRYFYGYGQNMTWACTFIKERKNAISLF